VRDRKATSAEPLGIPEPEPVPCHSRAQSASPNPENKKNQTQRKTGSIPITSLKSLPPKTRSTSQKPDQEILPARPTKYIYRVLILRDFQIKLQPRVDKVKGIPTDTKTETNYFSSPGYGFSMPF
jgi:hypothetical protein